VLREAMVLKGRGWLGPDGLELAGHAATPGVPVMASGGDATTKNDEGRVVYLTPELARLLSEQLERVRTVERKTGRIIPYVFPYLSGRRRIGQRRRDFRKAWDKVCEQAGCPGCCATTFDARPYGTWSTPASPSGSRCP
jgi:integrase